MKAKEFQYVVYALVAAIFMATIGVFSRFSQMPAEQVTYFRLCLGAAFLFVVVAVQRKSLRLNRTEMVQAVFVGALLAGFIVFYIQAMNWTLMATAIFFVYLAPVLAALMGRVFGKEHLSGWQLLLMAVALVGFFLMQQGIAVSDFNRGIVYALLAMLCYAGFIFINRRVPETADPTVYAFWQLLAGSLVVLPLCVVNGVSWTLEPAQWGLMLLVGFFPGFIALYAAILALKHLSTSVYGTIAYAEPVTVAFFGWVIFSEQLTFIQICGASFIIVAGILQSLQQTQKSSVAHRQREL